VQIGAFGVPALLPALIPAWSLTNTEAGWIGGVSYAAYTLVVPLLSSLTDRVDPKRVYLGSVALPALAFAGALRGWRRGSGRRSCAAR
jgi:MFS family permease